MNDNSNIIVSKLNLKILRKNHSREMLIALFRFFYSYKPIEDGGPNNGELGTDQNNQSIDEDDTYYYYFNTYPLEYGEFLLDSALARGVYYHTMAANDAFYERNSTYCYSFKCNICWNNACSFTATSPGVLELAAFTL